MINMFPNVIIFKDDSYIVIIVDFNSTFYLFMWKIGHIWNEGNSNMLKEDQEKYDSCSECHEYLTSDEDVQKSMWPSCLWCIFKDLSIQRYYGTKIWKFTPVEWRYLFNDWFNIKSFIAHILELFSNTLNLSFFIVPCL